MVYAIGLEGDGCVCVFSRTEDATIRLMRWETCRTRCVVCAYLQAWPWLGQELRGLSHLTRAQIDSRRWYSSKLRPISRRRHDPKKPHFQHMSSLPLRFKIRKDTSLESNLGGRVRIHWHEPDAIAARHRGHVQYGRTRTRRRAPTKVSLMASHLLFRAWRFWIRDRRYEGFGAMRVPLALRLACHITPFAAAASHPSTWTSMARMERHERAGER
jgi:hypothetical protein